MASVPEYNPPTELSINSNKIWLNWDTEIKRELTEEQFRNGLNSIWGRELNIKTLKQLKIKWKIIGANSGIKLEHWQSVVPTDANERYIYDLLWELETGKNPVDIRQSILDAANRPDIQLQNHSIYAESFPETLQFSPPPSEERSVNLMKLWLRFDIHRTRILSENEVMNMIETILKVKPTRLFMDNFFSELGVAPKRYVSLARFKQMYGSQTNEFHLYKDWYLKIYGNEYNTPSGLLVVDDDLDYETTASQFRVKPMQPTISASSTVQSENSYVTGDIDARLIGNTTINQHLAETTMLNQRAPHTVDKNLGNQTPPTNVTRRQPPGNIRVSMLSTTSTGTEVPVTTPEADIAMRPELKTELEKYSKHKEIEKVKKKINNSTQNKSSSSQLLNTDDSEKTKKNLRVSFSALPDVKTTQPDVQLPTLRDAEGWAHARSLPANNVYPPNTPETPMTPLHEKLLGSRSKEQLGMIAISEENTERSEFNELSSDYIMEDSEILDDDYGDSRFIMSPFDVVDLKGAENLQRQTASLILDVLDQLENLKYAIQNDRSSKQNNIDTLEVSIKQLYDAQSNVERIEDEKNNQMKIGRLADALYTLQDNEQVPEEEREALRYITGELLIPKALSMQPSVASSYLGDSQFNTPRHSITPRRSDSHHSVRSRSPRHSQPQLQQRLKRGMTTDTHALTAEQLEILDSTHKYDQQQETRKRMIGYAHLGDMPEMATIDENKEMENDDDDRSSSPDLDPNNISQKLNKMHEEKQSFFDRWHELDTDVKLQEMLSTLPNWDLDFFGVEKICGDYTLAYVAVHIYNEMNIKEHLNISEIPFLQCMIDVGSAYLDPKKVLYHNASHGCDVMCSHYYLIQSTYFENYSKLDLFASIVACACHDVGHDGFTNGYHIRVESDYATRYNDLSVLENYHASLGWRLIRKHHVLSDLTKDQKLRFRDVFTKCILSTDMAKHKKHSTELETIIKYKACSAEEIPENIRQDVRHIATESNILGMCLHACDVSNVAKPFPIAGVWVDRLMAEFFSQGDEEKKKNLYPISPLCDQLKTKIPATEMAFIEYVVNPYFELISDLLGEICDGFLPQLKSNYEEYKRLSQMFQEKNDKDLRKSGTRSKSILLGRKISTSMKRSRTEARLVPANVHMDQSIDSASSTGMINSSGNRTSVLSFKSAQSEPLDRLRAYKSERMLPRNEEEN